MRLHKGNAISDFLGVLGATEVVDSSEPKVNRSLSPLHIKILKSLPGLRKPHTPVFDTIVQRCFPSTERSPWILTNENMQFIVDLCRQDNERLMELLSPEDAQEMKRDQRWWSIEPYRNRPPVTEEDFTMTPDELRSALENVLRALVERRRS